MRDEASDRDTPPERTPDGTDDTIRKTMTHHTPSLPTRRWTRRSALVGAIGVGGIIVIGGRIQGDPSPDPTDYASILDGMAGVGSEGDPYVITDAEELQAIAHDPDAFYELGNDIDANETTDWNDGAGFTPIEEFTGNFDGKGHDVVGLTINRPDEDEVGLFAIGRGLIEDITFSGYEIRGGNSTGGIVGAGTEPTLKDITVNNGQVEGITNVGGLVGSHDIGGSVNRCQWTGDVEGEESVGGLVGLVGAGGLLHSTSTGSVEGEANVGGLVGTQGFEHSIETCHADGDVTGSESVGGLVGDSGTECEVIDSSATGPVTGQKNVGGLVGNCLDNSIMDSFATGTVAGDENVGGLAGAASWNISITGSHAEGDISGEENVGGLTGSVEDANVVESFATGSAEGDSNVGGLIGAQVGYSAVQNSYATGPVTGESSVGGLVGHISDSSVSTSYALGNVSGRVKVGGLAGNLLAVGEVSESYAAGTVNGDTDVGGLVGSLPEDSAVTDSYWDVPATSQDESAGGTGLGSLDEDPPAPSMIGDAAIDAMDGFDFADTWEMVQNSYPILSAIDPDRQTHLLRWQIDFGEGTEPPIPPLYYPNDGLWALGNMWDGVIENPSGWRQDANGQLGDLTVSDDQFTFDDPEDPSEVTIEFAVDEGSEARDLHLAIFSMPGPFELDEIEDQVYIDSVSEEFAGGEDGELTLQLP